MTSKSTVCPKCHDTRLLCIIIAFSCSFYTTQHQHQTWAQTFTTYSSFVINGLVSSFAAAFCILRSRGEYPSIGYLLLTKLRRRDANRWTPYTIHKGAIPTWRVKNASAAPHDDIFVHRGPQSRRHSAHRHRKTKRGHVEYITAT